MRRHGRRRASLDGPPLHRGPRQRTSGRRRRCPHRRQPGCASRTAGSVRRPKPGCRPRPVPGGESRRRSRIPPAAPGGPLRGALSLEARLRATPIRAPLVLHSAALVRRHLTRDRRVGARNQALDLGPATRGASHRGLHRAHLPDQLLEALLAGLTDELIDGHTPMVVRPHDHSGPDAVRKYGPFDRLGARRASLYLPQAATRTPGWARTSTEISLPISSTHTTVWYLRCGNWNGIPSPPP